MSQCSNEASQEIRGQEIRRQRRMLSEVSDGAGAGEEAGGQRHRPSFPKEGQHQASGGASELDGTRNAEQALNKGGVKMLGGHSGVISDGPVAGLREQPGGDRVAGALARAGTSLRGGPVTVTRGSSEN